MSPPDSSKKRLPGLDVRDIPLVYLELPDGSFEAVEKAILSEISPGYFQYNPDNEANELTSFTEKGLETRRPYIGTKCSLYSPLQIEITAHGKTIRVDAVWLIKAEDDIYRVNVRKCEQKKIVPSHFFASYGLKTDCEYRGIKGLWRLNP